MLHKKLKYDLNPSIGLSYGVALFGLTSKVNNKVDEELCMWNRWQGSIVYPSLIENVSELVEPDANEDDIASEG
jgi:hypothetical protein